MIELVEEFLGRLLRRPPQREGGWNLPVGCPGEESLAAYLDGGLSELAQGEMENHLADCRHCLDQFLAAEAAVQDRHEARVPTKLTDRAMALMPQFNSIGDVFTIVVEFVRDSLSLVSTSGNLVVSTPAAQIRGKDNSADIPMLQIESALGELQVAVEIERLEGDLCQVVVNVKTSADALADGLRFSLLSGNREQASYLARQGSATFERIPPGEYELAVFESGHSLGAIRLTIKEYRDE